MTVYFMDTSALVKHYVAEIGSVWVTALVQPQALNVIVIAHLTLVEVCSVLARLHRAGQLSQQDAVRIRAGFLTQVEMDYLVFPLDSDVMARARDLVNKYPLRSLDAIQLACAIEAQIVLEEPLTFLTADTDLFQAAIAESFSADTPLAHP